MSGGKRRGAGRKLAQIDLVELEKLCALQCTDAEIASWFGVSIRTIESRRKQAPYALAMERGRGKGKISIRRNQMKLLELGNATMAIWLGKNYLDQRDHPVELTGANGTPIKLSVEVFDAILGLTQEKHK